MVHALRFATRRVCDCVGRGLGFWWVRGTSGSIYSGSLQGKMGKYGNLLGYVLWGYELVDLNQYVNATLVQFVIAILWQKSKSLHGYFARAR